MASSSLQNLSWWILLFISLGIHWYCFIYYKREKQEKHKHYEKFFYSQTILKSLPFAWCCWKKGDAHIQLSPAFRSLFHLDSTHSIRAQEFFGLIGENNVPAFQRALTHLEDYGGAFTLELSLSNHSKHLRLEGIIAHHQPPSEESSPLSFISSKEIPAAPSSLIIICVQEITEEYLQRQKELSLLEKTQKNLKIMMKMIDASPVALWYRDPDGRIYICNKAYADILDTTTHKVIAENRELVDQFGEMSTYKLSKRALAYKNSSKMRSHIVIKGQRKFFEFCETPIFHQEETIGYALDLTELESVEKELRLTIQAQTDILNQLSSPVAIYASDTRMIFFNTAYVTMFNQDANWLSTNPTLSEIMEHLRNTRKLPEYTDFRAHREGRMKLFNSLLEPIHEIMHQPDGVICRLVIAPTPTGGLVYIFDNITDKLSLERRYNTLIAVQKETIDHLFEGIMVFGTDYRLRLSNPATSHVLGIPQANHKEGTHLNEVLESVMPHFRSSKSAKEFRLKLMDILSRRYPERQRLLFKKDKTLECTYVPLPDGSHLLSLIDVSDTWRFEKMLQEKNQALEHHDRLKTDFISHVSYELQSPLQTITGFSEILMNQYFGTLNEKQIDYCKSITEASKRLSYLMHDLLDLASLESGALHLNYSLISLDNLIASLTVLIHNRVNDHGLEFIIENLIPGTEVFWDSKRIRHAFFNLLSNAIKFTPSGGRITLRVSLNEDNQEELMVHIIDTGVGMPESMLQRIQQFFATGDSEHLASAMAELMPLNAKKVLTQKEGLSDASMCIEELAETLKEDSVSHTVGLGLTLVHRVIELHGGRMSLHSALNQGTSIGCILPLGQDK